MLKTILLVVLLGASQTPAAADSGVEGVWNTGSLDGRVQILRCGGKLCGRVIDGAALRTNPDLRDVRNRDAGLRQRRVKGLVVLQGFSGGPRDWSGGPVYDPQTGDGANSGRLKLRDDGKLEVKGLRRIHLPDQGVDPGALTRRAATSKVANRGTRR